MKAKKKPLFVLKILFTILLLWLVFQSVDISKISGTLGAFNFRLLLLLLAVYWASQLICSQRWRIFAAGLQMTGSYASFVRMYFVGMFFNIGLPSLVGGDVVKAYMLSRNNEKSFEIGLASTLQDRAAGLISLLFIGSLAAAIHPVSWQGIPLWTVYLAGWALVLLFFRLIAKSEGIYDRFLTGRDGTFSGRIIQKIARLHRSLGIGHLGRGALLKIALLSLAKSGLTLWVYQQVTVAAAYPVPLIPFISVFPLIIFLTMIPITIGGLGMREWAYVEALSVFGIPGDAGLAISLATSALIVLCNAAGILFAARIPREMRLKARDFF